MVSGLETFAKVRALHDRTDHPGEKAAAAGRMDALARAAGMTTAEAVSKLDTTPPTKATSRPSFSDIFDTPFFREAKAERDRERTVRWREVLEEYGTEEAVFYPGPMERALDEAAARFGSDPGWDAYPLSNVPPAIVATIEAAWPMPGTVREAWIEFAFWEKLGSDREARGTAYGDPSPALQIRCRILERALDEMSALSLNDLRARMAWLEFLDNRDAREHGIRLATLRADIERMGVRIREQDTEAAREVEQGVEIVGLKSQPASYGQSGQQKGSASDAYPLRRTNAEKRRDVLDLLNAVDPGIAPLTDREIARRAGVSPQTVGNIRRAQQ